MGADIQMITNKIFYILFFTMVSLWTTEIILKILIIFVNRKIDKLKSENKQLSNKIEMIGFFRCEKCSCEYLFTNLIEFDSLIDGHVCRKVPV